MWPGPAIFECHPQHAELVHCDLGLPGFEILYFCGRCSTHALRLYGLYCVGETCHKSQISLHQKTYVKFNSNLRFF